MEPSSFKGFYHQETEGKAVKERWFVWGILGICLLRLSTNISLATPIQSKSAIKKSTANAQKSNAYGSLFAGVWLSNWGTVTFNPNLTGHWAMPFLGNGQITDGHFDPDTNKLVFHFYQPWNRAKGTGYFTYVKPNPDANFHGINLPVLRGKYTQKDFSGKISSGLWEMQKIPTDSLPEEKTASLTIYVDETDLGHVFIELQKPGNPDLFYGWYPELPKGNGIVTGLKTDFESSIGKDGGIVNCNYATISCVHDESGWASEEIHHRDVQKTYPITPSQYNNALWAILKWKDAKKSWQSIGGPHCGDFALTIARAAGIYFPGIMDFWDRPKAFGDYLINKGGTYSNSIKTK